MFDCFFTTQNNSDQEIQLFGDKQQKHTILLSKNQQVEYFRLEEVVKPCNATINNVKACDYVLIDHNNKKILLCELKNSQNADTIKAAKTQLKHSKHIVNLFLNILEKNEYLYVLLTLSKRQINKRRTRTIRAQTRQYTETNLKEFKFNDLQYEKY